jgi:hypothetical protein
MKFSLARPALALAISLTLASCGGGGSDNGGIPISVTVFNVQYEGLTLATNGLELAVPKQAAGATSVKLNFPSGLKYGDYYEVMPKGGAVERTSGNLLVAGSQPAHQTCAPALGYPRWYGTAGQTASITDARTPAIEIFYTCSINTLALTGTVTGLTSGTLTLTNGSNGATTVSATTDGTVKFTLPSVPFGSTYGVSVVPPQPAGLNCTVTNGVGIMDEAMEKTLAAGGSTNVQVNCAPAT